MSEPFHNLNYICLFILGIQNLCRKAFDPIFTKEFVLDLNVKHAFHGIKCVWIQTSRWTKWDGTIKPFYVSFWVVPLFSSLGRKVCTQDDVVFDIVIIKHKNLFLVDAPVLVDLDYFKSCIVRTSCISRWPERVFMSLVSPSNFVIMPFVRADLLIIETFKPESKRTQKSLWLLMVPIVKAVQMITGNCCLEILIFCPWNKGASASIL